MPYSLRSKITGLVYKGMLSKEEGARIREALKKQKMGLWNMTNEEAIKRIDFKMVHCNNALNCDWECEKCSEAESMVMEALEKQIPKKPSWTERSDKYHEYIAEAWCPSCECEVDEDRDSWCPSCGQKLEWE